MYLSINTRAALNHILLIMFTFINATKTAVEHFKIARMRSLTVFERGLTQTTVKTQD